MTDVQQIVEAMARIDNSIDGLNITLIVMLIVVAIKRMA